MDAHVRYWPTHEEEMEEWRGVAEEKQKQHGARRASTSGASGASASSTSTTASSTTTSTATATTVATTTTMRESEVAKLKAGSVDLVGWHPFFVFRTSADLNNFSVQFIRLK